MSNTPRTDSMRGFHDLDTAVDAEFSEQLECELNESNKIIRQQQLLDEENLMLKNRIKRLEEALTTIELAMKQPASNHRFMQIAGPARHVINIIKKAKEAKL